MLKDIFPQNSIDLGILKKTGLKGVIYKYFSLKEQKLYKLSDVIGCTSEANIRYVKEHNELDKRKSLSFVPTVLIGMIYRCLIMERKRCAINMGYL